MGFKFYCIKCGLKMEIAENLIEVKFPCPKCGKKYFVDMGYINQDDTNTQYLLRKAKLKQDSKPSDDSASLRVAKVIPGLQTHTKIEGGHDRKWAPAKAQPAVAHKKLDVTSKSLTSKTKI